MVWKVLGGIWFLIALGVALTWIAHGTQVLTKDRVPVITKRLNSDFGIEEEIVEWKPQFKLGLDYGIPAMVLCAGVGFVCMRVGSRLAQRNSSTV
jgi:hypothetical protein